MNWQSAIVREIVPRTPRITSFFFELPEPFSYLAGQHVDVRLTAPDGYHAMRSYSIASAPSSGARIELAIERLDDGEVSPFFHDVVAPGDSIDLRGPLGGHFVWDPADARPLLLIGGGSGVVPLVSMLRERRLRKSAAPAALLYSVRTRQDAIYPDELPYEALSVLAVTRGAPWRPGDFARRIDSAMIAELIARMERAPERTYVCGSNAFVDAATAAAIAAGLDERAIRTERYGV